MANPTELVLPKDVTEMLNVKVDTLKLWRRRGFGPTFFRVGRTGRPVVLYDVSSVISFKQKFRQSGTERRHIWKEAA